MWGVRIARSLSVWFPCVFPGRTKFAASLMGPRALIAWATEFERIGIEDTTDVPRARARTAKGRILAADSHE